MAGSMVLHPEKSMSFEILTVISPQNIVQNAFHTHFDGTVRRAHSIKTQFSTVCSFFLSLHHKIYASIAHFRLSTKPCHCEYHSLCDTYQKTLATEVAAAASASSVASSNQNPLENPSLCEMENVHKVYNEIANHFSETRHSPWPQVNEFIRQFETGSVLVDIGCGNGKYLQSNRNIFEVARKNILSSSSCFQFELKKNSVIICSWAVIEVKVY